MSFQIHTLALLFTIAVCATSFQVDDFIDQSAPHRRELIQGAAVIGPDISIIPEKDTWPYTVALARCNQNATLRVICGGSLIHPYVVLTAAHCIKSAVNSTTPDPNTFCIIHGSDNVTQVIENPSNFTVIPAEDIAVNPSYLQYRRNGEFHITGDVALLFLSEPVNQPADPDSYVATTTSNPGYALLPDPRQNWDRRNFGFLAVAIGWGITENATLEEAFMSSDPEPHRLTEERITFQVAMSNEECIAPFFYGMEEQSPDTFCGAWFGSFENMIVRKNSTVTATICKGDSGGPLVIPGTMMDVFNFQGDVQIGIVSAGPPCPYLPPEGVVVWPAEYVDVSRYVDWIHEEMRKRGLTPLPVATSPLKRAYRDQTCYPGNCYDQDLMAGVGNNAPKAVTSGGSRSVARGGMAAAVAAVTLTVVIKFL